MIISNQKGLSLIETLVTLGIFSMVVVFTMGLFVNANKAQVAAREMNLVNDEASFLLERISREIRMASKNDDIDITVSNGDPNHRNKEIKFTNNENLRTVYCMAAAACDVTGQNIAVSYNNGANYTLINSSNVKIDMLKFYLNGDIAANEQPAITIVLKVSSKKVTTVSTSLQTSVVPRVY